MGVNLVAVVWGFAEATLFFIVPDVWLSLAARERLRPALVACLWALVGAVAGGAVMYVWGIAAADDALATVKALPAIDADMIERVRRELSADGALALLLGPFSGTPYKLYALQAANAGLGPIAFLLISVPARLGRFVVVAVVSHFVLAAVRRRWPAVNSVACLLVAWTVFYSWYFTVMPG